MSSEAVVLKPGHSFVRRGSNKWRRFSTGRWARRDFSIDSPTPLISFTFDDFPLSGYSEGGRILEQYGARGTYFVSCSLLGADSISGPIATARDLAPLLQAGHELGCHTFEHLDGTKAPAGAFRQSIAANKAALTAIVPGAELPVFAYPLDGPDLGVKREVGRHFRACRGGGQTFNAGQADLNLLKAFFLDWKSRDDVAAIKRVIDGNTKATGWLIFATHDVVEAPSAYGCSPALFEEVVRLSCQSGARVLPVKRVCDDLGIC